MTANQVVMGWGADGGWGVAGGGVGAADSPSVEVSGRQTSIPCREQLSNNSLAQPRARLSGLF